MGFGERRRHRRVGIGRRGRRQGGGNGLGLLIGLCVLLCVCGVMAAVKAYQKRVKKVEQEQQQFLQQKKARKEKRKAAKRARKAAAKAEDKDTGIDSDSDSDDDEHDDDEQKVLKAAERERAKEIQEKQVKLLNDILEKIKEEDDPDKLDKLLEQQNALVAQMKTFEAEGYTYEGGIPNVETEKTPEAAELY